MFFIHYYLSKILFFLGNPLPHVRHSQLDQTMDAKVFESATWQRVFQYLEQFDRGVEKISVSPRDIFGDQRQCLQVLLRQVCY